MNKLTATLLVSLALTGAAVAAPSPPPLVLDVELRDAGPSAAATRIVTLSLALARVGDCASAELGDGARLYVVELCRPDAEGTITTSVTRESRGTGTVEVRKLRVSSRPALGARTVVARAEQAPGGFEVAMTVR